MAEMISTEEFLALEQKVMQTVDLIRTERELRAQLQAELESAMAGKLAAERELAVLRAKMEIAGPAMDELEALQNDRDRMRASVEKMLAAIDTLI